MLHNNYYNNYIPYNNNMYYRPTPIYPNIEATSIDDSYKPVNNQDTFKDSETEKVKDFMGEQPSSNKDRLSLFGLSLNIDDIIIVGILIFLFFESKRDYLLLIILGLLLFDISLDTFKNMDIFKRLFNPT